MRRAIKATLTSALLASMIGGCAMDGDKGEEDDGFDTYESKADSFGSPTEHGPMTFAIAQQATIKDGELFHAWDFTLSGQAAVDLATSSSGDKLDTVMYLYRRDPETHRFGRFLFKNDDDNPDTIASRIARPLEAGEYRVLVKGFKRALRGRFSLSGACDGAGCPTSTCDTEVFAPTPQPAAGSCGELLSAALDGNVRDHGQTVVTLDQRCGLAEPARLAVEYYFDFWDDLVGWEDQFQFDPDEPVSIDVEWSGLDNGTTMVRVDGGGDEATMDFVIDQSGALVAHYLHNQSPELALFCDGGNTAADEECGRTYLDSMPHAAASERSGSANVTAADAQSRLDSAAFDAYDAYVRELGLAPTTPVTVEFTTWDNPEAATEWQSAGRITVRADGHPAHRYELATASTTGWQFTVKRGDGPITLDCHEL